MKRRKFSVALRRKMRAKEDFFLFHRSDEGSRFKDLLTFNMIIR